MKKNGNVKGYAGHHINDVDNHKDIAGDPDNIRFLKTGNKKSGGAKKLSKHYNEHFKNGKRNEKTIGELIKRLKLK